MGLLVSNALQIEVAGDKQVVTVMCRLDDEVMLMSFAAVALKSGRYGIAMYELDPRSIRLVGVVPDEKTILEALYEVVNEYRMRMLLWEGLDVGAQPDN